MALETDIALVAPFGDLLVHAANHWPDKTGLVFPERRLTNREYVHAALQAARSLRALGVERGTHVGFLMPNCPEVPIHMFAVAMLGAAIVPINARLRGQELVDVIADSDIEVLLTSSVASDFADYVQLLTDLFPELSDAPGERPLSLERAPRLRHAVLFGGGHTAGLMSAEQFGELAGRVDVGDVHRARRGVRLRDVAFVLYTSGTTARPKGCLLTHEAFVRNSLASSERLGLTHDEIVWCPLPMFHVSSIIPMAQCTWLGATYVGATRFDPSAGLRQIAEERVTFVNAIFDVLVQMIFQDPAFEPEQLRAVRIVANVGAPQIREDAQRKLPWAAQFSASGMTETCGTTFLQDPSETFEVRLEGFAPPLDGLEVRVVGPLGEPLPPRTPGELQVRGYSVFEGYHKDPEHTAACFTVDGWFRTGDLVEEDEAGRFVFRGRIKDTLKVGGENVAAVEIEDLLCRHPAVKLAQVVGRPDRRLAEVPVAFVELKPDAEASEGELIEFCRGKIASFKVPREVRFVTEWPMSGIKIKKLELRKLLDAENEP